jgi:hypothetical protein
MHGIRGKTSQWSPCCDCKSIKGLPGVAQTHQQSFPCTKRTRQQVTRQRMTPMPVTAVVLQSRTEHNHHCQWPPPLSQRLCTSPPALMPAGKASLSAQSRGKSSLLVASSGLTDGKIWNPGHESSAHRDPGTPSTPPSRPELAQEPCGVNGVKYSQYPD